MFNNIYKGALGEAVGCCLLGKLAGISLETINDVDVFELFDFKVKDKPIYVDFKNWKENTKFNRKDMLNKIFRKLDKCGGKCALIINILAESDSTYRPNITKKDGKCVIEIPYLYSGRPLKLNEEAVIKIRECIDEFTD